jgi:ribosomal 30S subunit maturation factor RimM
MITFEPEYKAKLWEIQNKHLTQRAVLVPHNEKILNIDLNTRTVEVPGYLSV